MRMGSVLKGTPQGHLSGVRLLHVSHACFGVRVKLCDTALANEIQVELASMASGKSSKEVVLVGLPHGLAALWSVL